MKLRPYQENAIESAIAAVDFFDEKNVIIDAPTGSGKSVLISELCKRLDGHIVVMVNISPLIDQIAEHLTEMGIEFSVLKAGMEDQYDESQRVQLIMSQTFYARSEKLNISSDYLIIDERHREYNTERTIALREAIRPRAIIGLTATPYDQAGMGLFNSFLIDTVSVRELTEQGFLTPIRYMIPKWSTQLDLDGLRSSGADYSGAAIDEKFNNQEFMSAVIKSMNEVDAKSHKGLVFCNSIEQAELVLEYLKQDKYNAYTVHSKNSKEHNKKIMDDFREPGPKILVSVSKLNVGFDIKDVTLGVMLRPTKVRSLYIQTIGRLTRTSEGKSESVFLDLAGTVMEHGFHDEPYLAPQLGDGRNLFEIKKDAAAKEIKFIVNEEPTEVVRHDVDVIVKELKKKESQALPNTMHELSMLYEQTENTRVIVEVAHKINQLKTGATYKTHTVDWISNKLISKFDEYPNHESKWKRAIKTRAQNIVRDGKKLSSLYYFIDFLIEKEQESNYY